MTLVALAVIVAAIMYLCIVEGHNDALPEFAMIALAAFTFYNAIVAIITATKTMKGDLRQQTLLRVSIAATMSETTDEPICWVLSEPPVKSMIRVRRSGRLG